MEGQRLGSYSVSSMWVAVLMPSSSKFVFNGGFPGTQSQAYT